MKQLLNRASILSFLLIFEILFLGYFYILLDFQTEHSSLLSKILFFDTFLIEFLLVYALIYLLPKKNKFFNLLAFTLTILFICITLFQLSTYLISSDFLTQTALNNVEFIGFLVTWHNIKKILIILVILLIIPLFIAKIGEKYWKVSKKIFLGIFLITLSVWSLRFIPQIKKDTLALHYNHSALSYPPLYAVINLFLPKKHIKMTFNDKELALLRHAGFSFDPKKTYPLKHAKSYNSNIHFDSKVKTPNVILIFTEGTSARTLSMYNKKFAGLTPHLQNFVENNHTMLVKNYYNHTAATYKGLHGQLCSFFPSLGGAQWNQSIPNSENIHYQCLSNILNLYGYDTSFLNVHLKDKSGNDEMASHLGYKNVISAEGLKEDYLEDKIAYREHELTDHQAYSALTNYLKKEKEKEKPFFITMYTAETHAWCDISKDGKPYKNGESEVENTIFNMDDAFGKFWNYFQHSQYADNTIIIFTSDHAHYFDDNYYKLMAQTKERYHKIFVDKVPLFVYAPMLKLPQTLDVNRATSVHLTPTILHLLGIQNISNSFLGNTLFEKAKTASPVNVAAYDSNIYIIDKNKIHHNKQTSKEGKKFFDLIAKFFSYTHQLELNNNIYPK